ncbi:hypothetical protein ES703_13230 [subsurface metagenome]
MVRLLFQFTVINIYIIVKPSASNSRRVMDLIYDKLSIKALWEGFFCDDFKSKRGGCVPCVSHRPFNISY